MKEKYEWAEGYIEGLKMEFCRPPTEKEIWISGFEVAKRKLSNIVCDCCNNPQSCLDLGEDGPESTSRREWLENLGPPKFTFGSGPDPEDPKDFF